MTVSGKTFQRLIETKPEPDTSGWSMVTDPSEINRFWDKLALSPDIFDSIDKAVSTTGADRPHQSLSTISQ